MDALTVALVMALGVAAGSIGALLGLGGGIFLVPLLTLLLGLPIQQAAGISLMTVIGTSGAVTGGGVSRGLVNVRLGMLLLVFASLGGLAGGVTAQLLSERTLARLFSVTTGAIAILTLSRLDRRNTIDQPGAEPNWLGARFFEHETGRQVVYRVRRLPLAIGVSFVAGNVSGLLGLGGGILQVPALQAWCGVPVRVAAATSALLIGITALASAPIYWAHGDVIPHLAAAAVLGVLVGARLGLWWGDRSRARDLKLLLVIVLAVVSLLMWWKSA
jgi:uncharacterized protein